MAEKPSFKCDPDGINTHSCVGLFLSIHVSKLKYVESVVTEMTPIHILILLHAVFILGKDEQVKNF